MINPQEVMMPLSPVERLIQTHTRREHFGDEGIAMSNVEFKDLSCILQIVE